MRTLRIVVVAVALPGAVLLSGCKTEKSSKSVEVKHNGNETTVKKTETHKSGDEDVKRTETKKYRD